MNNYNLACAALGKVLNIDVKVLTKGEGLNDAAVYYEGKLHGYINWRAYEGCDAKSAYYELHSLCREWRRFYS